MLLASDEGLDIICIFTSYNHGATEQHPLMFNTPSIPQYAECSTTNSRLKTHYSLHRLDFFIEETTPSFREGRRIKYGIQFNILLK